MVKAMNCHPGDMNLIAIETDMNHYWYQEGHFAKIAPLLQKMFHCTIELGSTRCYKPC